MMMGLLFHCVQSDDPTRIIHVILETWLQLKFQVSSFNRTSADFQLAYTEGTRPNVGEGEGCSLRVQDCVWLWAERYREEIQGLMSSL